MALLETASPSEMKSRLRERPSPSHRHSHDSDHPSPPITPIHNPSRFSPAPDIFDSRWPGRLVPVNEPWPRGGSPFTLDVSQIVVVSGGADASLQSNESEPGSGTRATTNPPSNHPLPEPENGQVVSGAIPVISPDVLRAKGELEARAQQPEVKQPGARTWDGPPPEESEKTESTKTGPPAYSPGDTQSIPPLPAPLPIPPAIPPAGIRPLPVPSGGAGRRRSAGRRMPVRR
ncbi:hypothetical protein JB92DRAFT_180121 [Gautieria morchelliformis]|nr:hypothetical protein JB92DRAFT_180121 [Gautieria morchelliformis]